MKHFYLSLIFCFFNLSIKSQGLPQVIAPSPQSVSFAKYGDIPINEFTGLPQITVPLFNITSRDINIKIDLSYMNSGCKVAELPSWVGLGWNLNAGGVITRVVKGIPDEFPTGVLNVPWNPDSRDGSYLAGINSGYNDAESDIFYFNFGGYAGKFYLIKENGKIKSISSVRNDILISPPSQSPIFDGSWKITTPDGTQYYFGETTTSREWTRSNPTDPFTGVYYASAWYLTKIVSKKNNIVSFQYKKAGNHTTTLYSEVKHTILNTPNAPYPPTSYDVANTTTIDNDIVLLEHITFPGGKFEFAANTTRLDMPVSKSLDGITLVDDNGIQIKGYKFTYGYFNANLRDGKKLKLTDVVELNADNLPVNKPYSFRYNETKDFPIISSKSQDHWGFYNGAANTTLIPQLDRCNPYYSTYTALTPAQKTADRKANPAYAIIGMLEKIIYPTGGETNFEYEGNNYLVDKLCEMAIETKNSTINVAQSIDYPDNRTNIVVQEATLNVSIEQDLNIMLTATVRNNSGPINFVNAYFRLLDANGTKLSEFSFEAAYNNTYINKLYLKPGTYKLQIIVDNPSNCITFMDGFTYDCTINYTDIKPNTAVNGLVGGLRSKRIVSYDGLNHNNDLIKEFQYVLTNSSDVSSGYLYSYPVYAYPVVKQECGDINTPPSTYYLLRYVTSSVAVLGYFQGTHVGYKKVIITNKGKTDAGRTERIYSIDTLSNRYAPFVYDPGKDWESGNLLKETIFDSSGRKMKEVNNNYGRIASDKISRGAVLYRISENCKGFDIAAEYQSFTYSLSLDNKFYLSSEETKQYTYNTTGIADSMTSVNSYYYEHPSSMQLSRVKTFNSRGDSMTTINKYAFDFAGQIVYDSMVKRNQIGLVIEQSNFLRNIQTMKKVNNYNFINTDKKLIELSSVDIQQGTFPIETRANISKYDDWGNIQEQFKTNDAHEVYFWGYNNLYPVAKITGSDYNTAKQYINQTILDNISNTYTDAQIRAELNKLRINLPSALVTTYTYSLLKGITSETDPAGKTIYYEYDKLGRLKVIKDLDGKILKQFDYQYQASTQQ